MTDDPTAYPKIPGPFWRDPATNQLTEKWSTPELEATAGLEWVWTEKVDGMNIRIIWDGHRVSFAGRTLNASIPGDLVDWLRQSFGGEDNEVLFEQKFGAEPAVLYGEGFGGKIQKAGHLYGPEKRFVLFDVLVAGRWWLQSDGVLDVAEYFALERTQPILAPMSLVAAVEHVRVHPLVSRYGPFTPEGVVGHTAAGLRGRDGRRLSVKLKTRDLFRSAS